MFYMLSSFFNLKNSPGEIFGKTVYARISHTV